MLMILAQMAALLVAATNGHYYHSLYCAGKETTLDCSDRGIRKILVIQVTVEGSTSGSCGAETSTSTFETRTPTYEPCARTAKERLCRVCGNKSVCRIDDRLMDTRCRNTNPRIEIVYSCEQETGAVEQCVTECRDAPFSSNLCPHGAVVDVVKAWYGEEKGVFLTECNCCTGWEDCVTSVTDAFFPEITAKCNGRQSCADLRAKLPALYDCRARPLDRFDYVTLYYQCITAFTMTSTNGTHGLSDNMDTNTNLESFVGVKLGLPLALAVVASLIAIFVILKHYNHIRARVAMPHQRQTTTPPCKPDPDTGNLTTNSDKLSDLEDGHYYDPVDVGRALYEPLQGYKATPSSEVYESVHLPHPIQPHREDGAIKRDSHSYENVHCTRTTTRQDS